MIKTINSSLINSAVYLGAQKNNWRPESAPFTIGFKHNFSIFDVCSTNFYLSRASIFLEQTIKKGGRSFFFGFIIGNANGEKIIKRLTKMNQVVSSRNWQGGYITNTRYFKHSISNFTKKFNVVVSSRFDYSCFPSLTESNRIKLPLITPVDSSVSPHRFSYPIPCNSASSGAYLVISTYILQAIFKGLLSRPKSLGSFSIKKRFYFGKKNSTSGRRWNRTTALSFSGLNSTIELSPFFFSIKS